MWHPNALDNEIQCYNDIKEREKMMSKQFESQKINFQNYKTRREQEIEN